MSNLLKPGRDDRQKSWGCISASAFGHIVVLSLLALAAPRVQDLNGLPQANAGETIEMKAPDSDPKLAAKIAQNREVENHAVLLADSSDPNAVEMAPAKPTAPAKLVSKKAQALPTKKEAKAPIVAREDGDVEIKSALKVARQEQPAPEKKSDVQEEAKKDATTEEIEKDIPAPIKEEATPEDTAEEVTPAQPQPAPVVEEVTPPLPQKEVAKPVPVAAPVSAPATVSTPVRQQAPMANPQPIYVVRSAPVAAKASGYGTPSRVAGLSPAGQTVHPLSTVGGGTTGAANGERIRDVSELIARPGNPRVIYPTPDRMAHREGTSVVIGNVNADGSMGSVYLERSSGSRSMDLAALQTFKKWSFMPGQGGPVRKPFRFQLVGDAQEVPAQLKRQ